MTGQHYGITVLQYPTGELPAQVCVPYSSDNPLKEKKTSTKQNKHRLLPSHGQELQRLWVQGAVKVVSNPKRNAQTATVCRPDYSTKQA